MAISAQTPPDPTSHLRDLRDPRQWSARRPKNCGSRRTGRRGRCDSKKGRPSVGRKSPVRSEGVGWTSGSDGECIEHIKLWTTSAFGLAIMALDNLVQRLLITTFEKFTEIQVVNIGQPFVWKKQSLERWQDETPGRGSAARR